MPLLYPTDGGGGGGVDNPLTADLDFAGFKGTNVGAPTPGSSNTATALYAEGVAAAAGAAAQAASDPLGSAAAAQAASDPAGSAATAQANAEAYAQGLAYGISTKVPARYAAVGALAAYVATAQTLTASAPGAFPAQGTGPAPALNDRVLVKDETAGNTPNNGLYTLTTLGTGLVPWVLTRSTDANSATELCGATVSVETGNEAGNLFNFAADPTTFVVGATNVTWVQINVTTPDATTLVKGKLKLANDLGGTADNPIVAKLNGGTAPATPGAGDVGKAVVVTAAGTYGLATVPLPGTGLDTTGATHYWTFGEAAGVTTYADHIGTWNLTAHGTILSGDPGLFSRGSLAAHFFADPTPATSTDKADSLNNVAGTFAVGDSLTIECVMALDVANNGAEILAVEVSYDANNRINIDINPGGNTVTAVALFNSGVATTASAVLPACLKGGARCYVAVVLNRAGGTMKLYVNGIELATVASGGNFSNPLKNVTFGNYTFAGGLALRGMIGPTILTPLAKTAAALRANTLAMGAL